MARTAVDYDKFFVKPFKEPVIRPPQPRIDFGGANPGPDVVPIKDMAEEARLALLKYGEQLSLYPPAQGSPGLRDLIAQKMVEYRGFPGSITRDDILITNGSIHGIALTLECLVKPGDVIITDKFFYQGAVTQFRKAGAEMVTVAGDDEGMRMDILEEKLADLKKRRKKVKFIYTIPSPQNPDGSIMPVDRRTKMLELADKYDTLILEDDCYAFMMLDIDGLPPAIASLPGGRERVVYLFTFSKIIGPGIRIGWAYSNPKLLQYLTGYKQDGGANYLSSMIVQTFLEDKMATRVPEVNALMRRKRDAVAAALGEHFGPAVEFESPVAGMYIWAKFPDGADMQALEPKAMEKGVRFLSGPNFSPEGEGKNLARFNYSFPRLDQIDEGIGIVAEAAKKSGII